jgi:hypothetical protein
VLFYFKACKGVAVLSHAVILSSFFKLDHSINPTSFNCFADPEMVFSHLVTCSFTAFDELFLRTFPDALFTLAFFLAFVST